MTAKKTPDYSKLPKAVQELAQRGERYRFPGFWLYDSPRDRIIAEWLDRVTDSETAPEDRVNVAELVKDFLYEVATGATDDQTARRVIAAIMPRLESLERKLAGGVVVAGAGDPAGETDDAADIYDALGRMAD